jgi:hypothetical protein
VISITLSDQRRAYTGDDALAASRLERLRNRTAEPAFLGAHAALIRR